MRQQKGLLVRRTNLHFVLCSIALLEIVRQVGLAAFPVRVCTSFCVLMRKTSDSEQQMEWTGLF